MRLRLAPLINNPQPSPRYIGATVIGLIGIAIMGTIGHTVITGITVRIGAAGMRIGRTVFTVTTVPTAIMGITTVPTAITGIVALIGGATVIGITGAAGKHNRVCRAQAATHIEELLAQAELLLPPALLSASRGGIGFIAKPSSKWPK